ncbi:hypothetical protein Hanom_Chr11g01029641 [Helianthus anomalus]
MGKANPPTQPVPTQSVRPSCHLCHDALNIQDLMYVGLLNKNSYLVIFPIYHVQVGLQRINKVQ